ncbi:hypothetical protein [Faecalibacterium sp. PGM34]
MKISEKCKVIAAGTIAAGTIVAALMAGTALPALAISPAGCTSLAQIKEMNDDEEAQVQALKAAIAKVNVKYDEVQRSWQFDSPIYDKAEKNKTCCLSPWIYIFDGCKDVYFDEDFSYNGSSCIDLNTVYVRAGDNLYSYECDPDYTDYAYDTDKKVWWASPILRWSPAKSIGCVRCSVPKPSSQDIPVHPVRSTITHGLPTTDRPSPIWSTSTIYLSQRRRKCVKKHCVTNTFGLGNRSLEDFYAIKEKAYCGNCIERGYLRRCYRL